MRRNEVFIKMNIMKCSRCGKDAVKSTTTFVSDLGDVLVVIRNVPCYKCEECGEIMYTGDVVLHIEKFVNTAKELKQEVSIIDYMKQVA
ncbi:MAG: YgiT-type zinc finger protein [Paludibacteraceae bacterium]|nr:YgiT-type zinc finger protein [Paludibacteraceae bacterium]